MNERTEQKAEKKVKPTTNRMEINTTLILAVATLSITWCSYQSNLWNGIQTFRLEEANKYNRLAQEKHLMTIQYQAMDEPVVIDFVNNVLEKKQERINFSLSHIRPELAHVLRTWLHENSKDSNNRISNPMRSNEYKALYVKDTAEAVELIKKADKCWLQALHANAYSDRYSLLSVIFSMVMFLGGITTNIKNPRIGSVLIIISWLMCLAVLIYLIFFMPLAKE